MNAQPDYVLGLDIGANSIGWALFERDAENEPTRLLLDGGIPVIGAHVFEAGVDNFFGSGQGKEESRNAKRHLARMQRRMAQRRARRLAKTYNTLAGAGLLPALPPGSIDPRKARDEAMKLLDHQLSQSIETADAARLPYFLRVKALDSRLEPHQLGRALYHLAQRRGFLSNRKQAPKEGEEESSAIKKSIKDKDAEIDPSGADGKARTLGELLYRKNSTAQRARKTWTGRHQYLAEFDAIWNSQKPHRAVLTDDLKKELHKAIFYQRPLKSQAKLIGVCDIFDGVRHKPSRRRAPAHLRSPSAFAICKKSTTFWF